MHSFVHYSLKGQSLCLSADRSIYWEEQKALIVSDLHFGKTGHFRKSGIAVPQSVFKEDIQRLVAQIQFFKPSVLLVVGDMFHSHANKELELFEKWRDDFSHLNIRLIKGNHDILQKKWYTQCGIELFEPALTISEFCFQHDPGKCNEQKGNSPLYVFSGHIHPGITISGIGKQSLRFPCFYFTESYCVLPAFSRFTGTVNVHPENSEVAFAIVNNTLIRMG
jgi:DNA ligase-associated metallophosphoesterase